MFILAHGYRELGRYDQHEKENQTPKRSKHVILTSDIHLCTQGGGKLFSMHFSLQVMLLHSSLQLPPPVLVILLPSDVLLLETGIGSLSGEWVEAVSVSWDITQQVPILCVASQLQLGLGLVQEQLLLPTHQH